MTVHLSDGVINPHGIVPPQKSHAPDSTLLMLIPELLRISQVRALCTCTTHHSNCVEGSTTRQQYRLGSAAHWPALPPVPGAFTLHLPILSHTTPTLACTATAISGQHLLQMWPSLPHVRTLS